MPENNTTTETSSASNSNKTNAVGVFSNGKFIPYGYAGGVVSGVPVYIFNTIDDYNSAAESLPDPSVIFTLDDLDTGGFKFDSELNNESENAPQTKAVKEALDYLQSILDAASISPLESITVTGGEKLSPFFARCYTKNGICYVTLEATPKESLSHNEIVCTGLPIPHTVWYLSLPHANGNTSAAVLEDGSLRIYWPETTLTTRIDVSFCYPIAIAEET